MKKLLFYVAISLLINQLLLSQSSVVGIIQNSDYVSLQDADTVYTEQDSLRHGNKNSIFLNFDMPFFETNKIFFTYTGIEIRNDEDKFKGGSARLSITLMDRFETDGDDSGFITSDVGDSLKVKYCIIDGLKCTKVEVINNFYDAFPEYTFSYQYHFYENGRIEVHYGPNKVLPDFPSYSDMYGYGLYFIDGNQVGYYILSEDPKSPTIYDHISHPETSTFIENFKPFNFFPDTSLSYYISAINIVSSIKEANETGRDYELNISQNNTLRITPITELESYDVILFNALGQKLSHSSNNYGPSEIDLKKLTNITYLFVRIDSRKGTYFKKISLQ